MSQQNIYDNEIFFAGYKRIRENPGNANILFEIPALFSLLPDLKGKKILDLGCGYGDHCAEFVKMGAKQVVGIDISRKMLEVAEKENAYPNIIYRNLPMERIRELDEKFDLVVSSLAVHYVEDFRGLAENVHSLLKEGGLFVFSQENPINTCFSGGERWTKDAQGNKIHANLANYSVDGERCSRWFVDGVKKYHRTFSSVVNALVDAGFAIEKLMEPVPTEALMEQFPDHADLLHKPDFLVVRVRKGI